MGVRGPGSYIYIYTVLWRGSGAGTPDLSHPQHPSEVEATIHTSASQLRNWKNPIISWSKSLV